MAMRLTDIAKLAGVSKATASRAFSHPEQLREDTLKRVLDIASMFNYHPNALAKAVAHQRSGLVGFILFHKSRPFFGHTFYGPALDGFLERAKARGYHVLLGATTRRNDNFEEDFIKDSIEGAVLVTRDPEPLVKTFRARNIPVVLLNEESGIENAGSVMSDDYGGMTKIMSHLIEERGYENIAFFSNRLSHVCNMKRYFAYIDMLEKHGLEPFTDADLPEYDLLDSYEPNHFVLKRFGRSGIPRFGTPVIFPSAEADVVEKAMQRLLPLRKLPQAIVCSDDTIAIGVCHALQKAGIRIPEDVAVTGFDDIEMASYCTPSLTTIHVDPYELGAVAMDLLSKYMKDPDLPAERLSIGNELVVRESS